MNIVIATNNGDIGGGEVMLLNLARVIRALGHKVTVLGPASPDELLESARDEGFTTLTLPATDRKSYMIQLRAWRARNRKSLLWCNGLVPSLATAGDTNRIVHLHQLPTGSQKYAYWLAKKGARAILVPSHFVASKIKNSTVFENWVTEVPQPIAKTPPSSPIRVGFLGRPSLIKGTHTLAVALSSLNSEAANSYQLVVGGTAKFVDNASQNQVMESLLDLGDQVELLGWVTPEQLFAQTDLLVVPSEVDESFGLVAAEAMSARHPLVISNAGALPEVVGESYPWISRQKDSEHLAATVASLAVQLLANDQRLDEVLSENYWRWHELYSPDAGKERVRRLLKDLES